MAIGTLSHLLPSLEALPRPEKLQLMEWLAAQLAKEEDVPLLSPDIAYPVWSPYDSHEAAATLSAFLESEKAARK
jgi:hypothetical protein